MKYIDQILIFKKDGEIHQHFNSSNIKVDSTTQSLIEGCLDNYPYTNIGDITRAFKLGLKLKVEEAKIALEDSEFEFVKAKVESFVPYLNIGTVFIPFFKLFEESK